jgi:hypothetical protein
LVAFSRSSAEARLIHIPASLNRTNYARYKSSPSRVDFIEFNVQTHFIVGLEGWEEVAGYVTGWLTQL